MSETDWQMIVTQSPGFKYHLWTDDPTFYISSPHLSHGGQPLAVNSMWVFDRHLKLNTAKMELIFPPKPILP